MKPEFLAQTIVYDEIVGFSKHAQACYQCKAFLHANKRYNINIAFLDPKKGGPNHKTLDSDYPFTYLRWHDNNHAGWIQWKLSQHDCWTGMVVVQHNHHYKSTS